MKDHKSASKNAILWRLSISIYGGGDGDCVASVSTRRNRIALQEQYSLLCSCAKVASVCSVQTIFLNEHGFVVHACVVACHERTSICTSLPLGSRIERKEGEWSTCLVLLNVSRWFMFPCQGAFSSLSFALITLRLIFILKWNLQARHLLHLAIAGRLCE